MMDESVDHFAGADDPHTDCRITWTAYYDFVVVL